MRDVLAINRRRFTEFIDRCPECLTKVLNKSHGCLIRQIIQQAIWDVLLSGSKFSSIRIIYYYMIYDISTQLGVAAKNATLGRQWNP